VLVAIMMGGTLPIPLYVLYENQMGFGPLGVTVVFAAYVVGTLIALVMLGDLSDHFGRRKVMTVAVICAAVSSGLFLGASDIGLLITARIVSGLASGFITGTAAAALTELQPRGDRRGAAVVASGSNLAGLGLGPLVAGIFAEYVAFPTHSVFWLYLGVCASALAALVFIPETVRHPDRVFSLRLHLAIPASMRGVMVGACLGVFAAFSVLGSFSSLVPTFMHGILGVHNLALVGGTSFLAFMVAAISQAFSAGLPSRRSLGLGLPLLLVCLAALESALFAKLLWLFLVGTVVGGIAVGLIFRGGLSEINRLAEPRNRAATVSTFFVAAYVGLGLPAVLTGLISQLTGTVDASLYAAALSAAFVIAAVVVVFRSFGTAAPEASGTLSDSWCCPEEPGGLGAVNGVGGEHERARGSARASRRARNSLRVVRPISALHSTAHKET
jgi:MFS family permease